MLYPADWGENYLLWKEGEITANEFMRRTGLKRTTFYKLVKNYEEVDDMSE